MNRRLVLTDAAVVAAAVALVLIVSPGLAVVAIIALLVLAVCGITFAIESTIRRRRLHRGRITNRRASPKM